MQEEKSRIIEKVKAQINEWDVKLEEMKEAASKSSSEVKASYRDRIESLKIKRNALTHKLSLLADAADDAWKDFRKGVEEAWDELKHAFDDEETKDREGRR